LADHLVSDPSLLERFQREARLAAKISHVHVAKVYGNGIWNSSPYITMELIEGRNLQEIVENEGRLPIAAAWRYITQAAEALRAADQNGVVHRDIKPSNLMISQDDQVKVTDFGISRQTTVDVSITQTGTILGTPTYMAPEQAMGKHVDCRSDIYALGMTLYYALSGKPPFTGSNALEILAQQMSETPPSLIPEIANLTPSQEDVVQRMFAKKPEDRYQDYDALLADLRRHAPGASRLAPPSKRLAAEFCNVFCLLVLFVLAVVSFTVFFLANRDATGDTSSELEGRFIGWVMLGLPSSFVALYVIGIGRWGVTPGKRLLGLRVTRTNGERVGYLRSLLRFATAFPIFAWEALKMMVNSWGPTATFLDMALIWQTVCWLNLTLLVVSFVMLWRHPRRRTLHDLAAGTVVVRADD